MSNPRRLAHRKLPFLGAALLAVIAVACQEDATAPVLVAASDVSVKVSPVVAQALNGITFNFPGGAGALASSIAGQNLALTFAGNGTTTTTSGSVTSATGATTGTFTAATTFGSCIFAITASTFPAGSQLALGQTITVNPCNININSAGLLANGVAQTRSVSLVLGAASSAGASVTLSVNAGGQLTLNGQSVGTVTLTPVSG